MLGNQVPDKTVQKDVDRKLMQKCSSSNRIIASVRSGVATISGTIWNEHERRHIIRVVSAVQGVRSVADQIRVEERPKQQM